MAAPLPAQARRFVALCTAGSMLSVTGCMDYFDKLFGADPISPRGPAVALGAPQLWGGTANAQFEIGSDFDQYHDGTASGFIRTKVSQLGASQFGTLVQSVRADAFRGNRIRLTGWLKTNELVRGAGAGLWLRIDGASSTAIDNTGDRRIAGPSDWQEQSIVADVPDDAYGIVFGVILSSPGIVWADDFQLTIVDESIPVTTLPAPAAADTLALAAIFEATGMAPRNLDFEGVIAPASRTDTRDWIASNSFAFVSDDPSLPLAELEPLRQMIGNATLVGLGEGTHGTREFQRMKHRLVHFLVKEMGFSHFGIEASFTSAAAFDHYLQTGEGDPAQLLEEWYFWPWATEEFLDLLKWMRGWNAAGNTPRIRFFGVEMADLAFGVDSVRALVRRMDHVAGERVDSLYRCLTEIRNDLDPWDFLPGRYVGLPVATRHACRRGFEEVEALVTANESEWSAREGSEKVRLVRRYATLALRWETYWTLAASTERSKFRDQTMAENVSWWHEVQAPGTKKMVWAHNFHVLRNRYTMGGHLSNRHGADYLNMALTFGSGSFNATYIGVPDDTLPLLRAHTVPGYRDDALEAIFLTMGVPRLIFDTRAIRGPITPATEPLLSPLAMRMIGNSFNPRAPRTASHLPLQLRRDYDLFVWFEQGSPTTLRPLPPIP